MYLLFFYYYYFVEDSEHSYASRLLMDTSLPGCSYQTEIVDGFINEEVVTEDNSDPPTTMVHFFNLNC